MRSTKFKKMGTLGKIIILFVVVGIMSGVGVFTFKFFTRIVQCNEASSSTPATSVSVVHLDA